MWFASRVLDVQTRFRDVVADPGGDFRSKTGLSFPTSAKIIWVGDDHGGFHGDGAFPLRARELTGAYSSNDSCNLRPGTSGSG